MGGLEVEHSYSKYSGVLVVERSASKHSGDFIQFIYIGNLVIFFHYGI